MKNEKIEKKFELPRPSGRGYINNNKYAFRRKSFWLKPNQFNINPRPGRTWQFIKKLLKSIRNEKIRNIKKIRITNYELRIVSRIFFFLFFKPFNSSTVVERSRNTTFQPFNLFPNSLKVFWLIAIFITLQTFNSFAQNNAIFKGGIKDGFGIIITPVGGSLLPIELLYFNAACNQEKTILSWTTASETNNDYFTIERTTDGINYEVIGTIQSAGNSSSILHYKFIDSLSDNTELKYYRLKQTDYNGEFKYYDIIASSCSGNLNIISAYPNPSNGNFSVSVYSSDSGQINLIMYDILSQKVMEQVFYIEKGISNHNINVSMVSMGMYYIKATTCNGLYKSQKQVIIK